MSFTKNKGSYLAIMLISLAMYNVVAFVLPFGRHGGFWTGYGFTTLAILITTGAGIYTLGQKSLKSKFYGLPLTYVAWGYLIIQLIAGLVEMAVPDIPYKYGIALNTVLLGICLIGMISVDFGKEVIERIDEKVKEKVFYIKSLQVDIEGLVDRTTDESLKKALKALAETIRYSDPMSSPQLSALENKIEAKAAELAGNTADTNAANAIINELQMLFAERNRKCKLLK